MDSFFVLSQLLTTPTEVQLQLSVQDFEQNANIEILSATVRGPFCEFASTLPATIRFRPNNSQENHFTVTIPDPCYWTSRLPHQYRIEIQSQKRGVDKIDSTILIRGLVRNEVRKNALCIDGIRTIIRGIGWKAHDQEPAWSELRATNTTLVIPNEDVIGIPFDFLEHASQAGVTILVLKNESQDARSLSSQFSDYPAVLGFFSISTASHTDPFFQARVTLLGLPSVANAQANQLIIAVSHSENTAENDWQAKRAACDALQASTASTGEFAGYIVL